jgi:hypothetical protein
MFCNPNAKPKAGSEADRRYFLFADLRVVGFFSVGWGSFVS